MTINKWNVKQALAPYMFISPFLLLFGFFLFIPAVSALRLSLFSWNGVSPMNFVGFQNYIRLVQDLIFRQSIINGIVLFFMYVPIMLFIALVLAVLLNKPGLAGKGFYRAAFYIPNITSTVAVAFVFLLIFDTRYGFVNTMVRIVTGTQKNFSWFGNPWGARFVVSTLVLWRWMGYNMILFLAGLQNISRELYEAATIDGASPIHVFFRITMPLMKPIILFCTVLSTIGTFSLFTEPLLLTGGGPMYKTITPVLYIYSETFTRMRMGYAACISMVYFLLMSVFTLIQFRITKGK